MNGFLWTMVVGLAGLVLMALPGLRRHGPRGGHPGSAAPRGHPGHAGHALGKGATATTVLRLLPEPRTVFSLLVLFGAFANVLEKNAHLTALVAGVVALVPALGIEVGVVAPLWRFFLRFGGKPSSPLEALLLEEGRAVTPFRNGRGLVEVVRDGRTVQLSARLPPELQTQEVKVGDKLRIDGVDPEHERVTVSVL